VCHVLNKPTSTKGYPENKKAHTKYTTRNNDGRVSKRVMQRVKERRYMGLVWVVSQYKWKLVFWWLCIRDDLHWDTNLQGSVG